MVAHLHHISATRCEANAKISFTCLVVVNQLSGCGVDLHLFALSVVNAYIVAIELHKRLREADVANAIKYAYFAERREGTFCVSLLHVAVRISLQS